MQVSNIIEINKIFSDGNLINRSALDFAFSNVQKDNWQYNLAQIIKAIICEHAFFNGNKRTALTLILYYLRENNIEYNPNLLIKVIIRIAKMKKPNLKKIQGEINKCLL